MKRKPINYGEGLDPNRLWQFYKLERLKDLGLSEAYEPTNKKQDEYKER